MIFENNKKLGFGFMRLPVLASGEIDIGLVKQMADKFIKSGFTYFDTAFGYMDGKAEAALKQAVVDRYPRDTFTIADKMPLWEITKKEDI
ncbi:MAG: aldo/keto reductase, partial [Oscillospiraceae bacterium]